MRTDRRHLDTATPASIRYQLTSSTIGELSCRAIGDCIVTRVSADAWQFGLEKATFTLDDAVERVMKSIARARGVTVYDRTGRPVNWLQNIR
jgi:hypothetical protein